MENLNQKVRNFLEENYKYRKQEDEIFYFKIEPDYRDEIPQDDIEEIINSKDPMDIFYEKLFEWYEESEYEQIGWLVDEFKKQNGLDVNGDFDIDEDIREVLEDWIEIEYPVDWALEQKCCFDIQLYIGDDKYGMIEFYQNVHIINDEDGLDEDAEKCALAWLINQQGYTLEEFLNVWNSEKHDEKQPFLQSVKEEIINAYEPQILTFTVKMTLGKAIELKEMISDHPNGSIVLDKNVNCGLFDPWTGAGSLLNIICEKDVEIPFRNFRKFYFDSVDEEKYISIHAVYCVDDDFWKPCLKEVKTNEDPMKKFND